MAKKAEQDAELTLPTEGVEISHASLHQAVAIGTVTSIQSTLHKTKVPGLKMYMTQLGLFIKIKSRDGKVTSALIPHANVACAILKDEE